MQSRKWRWLCLRISGLRLRINGLRLRISGLRLRISGHLAHFMAETIATTVTKAKRTYSPPPPTVRRPPHQELPVDAVAGRGWRTRRQLRQGASLTRRPPGWRKPNLDALRAVPLCPQKQYGSTALQLRQSLRPPAAARQAVQGEELAGYHQHEDLATAGQLERRTG